MWWYIMIMIIIIFTLYGKIDYINDHFKFLFEIRLESEYPSFSLVIFQVFRSKI